MPVNLKNQKEEKRAALVRSLGLAKTVRWYLERVPMATLTENTVVPIVPSQSPYSAKLSEFNPMKFEGNAFLFDKVNQYQMFAALVRYLENIRYPGDKRTLVKNVSDTQI